ncbi:MAG: aldo/keto reductase [Bacteroidales bacterium]
MSKIHSNGSALIVLTSYGLLPSTEVYYRPEIFGEFDKLKEEGKDTQQQLSAWKRLSLIEAAEFDNVTTVQIIYNIFRQRPHERFFEMAREKNIGLIIRVPLASGLLSEQIRQGRPGLLPGDHRFINRSGLMFDRGETFSGVPYDTGLKAVAKLKELFPGDTQLAHVALQWILLREEVSCIIPGASSPDQVRSNIGALSFQSNRRAEKSPSRAFMRREVKPLVHQLW